MSRLIHTRALVPLAVASLLTLTMAGVALGKCQDPNSDEVCPAGMVATFDSGGSLTAGTTETVGVWVHGGEVPYAAEAVTILFSRVGDGTLLRVEASPTDLVGRYVATVELPAGGTWSLAAEVQGADFSGSLPLDTIQVNPPAAGPVAEPGSAPAPFPFTPWLGLAALAALAAGLAGAMAMTRRRQATVQG
jgi:hypothetical protein